MSSMVVENKTRPLVKTDLCDRCRGSAAMVARKLDDPLVELHFCNHHADKHRDALLSSGFYMDVETIELRN
jgi:hypothetical protein